MFIPLRPKGTAIIDAEDADKVLPYKWRIISGGYAARCRRRADGPGPFYIRLHAVILGEPSEGTEPDHISGNRLDNRKQNLRPATRSQNLMNKGMQSNNQSGYRGVHWFKHASLWTAKIQKNRQVTHLGYFHTPEEAAHAYDGAARELFGEFARLNFPDES